MYIGIDIDQTISTGYKGESLQDSIAHYRARGLILPEIITDYSHLFQLPEVLSIHEVFPDAVAGVTRLAQMGDIAYYTVRKHEDAQREKDMHEITRRWLAQQGFPCPDQVVFCRSVMQKLVFLYDYGKNTSDRLLLVDDRWRQALLALEHIALNQQYRYIAEMLRKRLTLVAFGASSLPTRNDDLSMLALPNWKHVADLLAVVY